MRLSLAILLFTFAFINKGNAHVYKRCADVVVTQTKGNDVNVNTSTADVTGIVSTKGHELNKGVQDTAGNILNLLCRYTYTSVEARHFLDGFFLSFFAYHSIRHINAKRYCLVHHIATDRALLMIYPYHSFW
ncbi:MAG: hypothetical protein JWQ09_4576 [Segetibacter sp.]|nr:hypothetical protein [Segetibacter sp.]